MPLVRFGVSLEKELLEKFDRHSARHKYQNRSEAIRDLIRDTLVKEEWEKSGGDVAGVVTLVYDHHKRELTRRLTSVQHDHQDIILATQHVHIAHDSCLEVIVVRGNARKIHALASALRSTKGVKHGGFLTATTGRHIE